MNAFICDLARTPIGRYAGALSAVRADDLGAVPLRALVARHPEVDWRALDDVVYGCANQAGEDNRNVARMCALLADLPVEVPGSTVNRLCGSGMDAVAIAARAIRCGEAELVIAGGVESMSRAPFVMPKAETAFSRANAVYDTTIGWRFVNPRMQRAYGIDSMPETAETVAFEYRVSREAQDRFALASQTKAIAAQRAGRFEEEIVAVDVPNARRGQPPTTVSVDEHPRETSTDALSTLKGIVRPEGSVTAGNASGVNDGACALLIAGERAIARFGLSPLARIVGSAVVGVPPRIMGIGPAPAAHRVLERAGLALDRMDLIELNEAFAAQALAVMRLLELEEDDPRINPLGGAIALGHPLGASGARLIATAVRQLHRMARSRYALCAMCIGVGQGIATIVERV